MRQRKGGQNPSKEHEQTEMTRFGGKAAQTPPRTPVWYLLLGAGASIVILIMMMGGRSSEKEVEVASSSLLEKDTANMSTGVIVEGEVQGHSRVPYYSCSGTGKLDMILLHGARFTKEDWKMSGLLKKLCNEPQISTVTALDLGNGANHAALKEVLKGLQTKEITSSQPVVLVTPSASGLTMVSWAEEDASTLKDFVKSWIPVASPAVARAETAAFRSLGQIPILAVYGSRDEMGKKVSQRLRDYANAQVIEIDGGHPCYLDSPDAFVVAVSQFLQSQ